MRKHCRVWAVATGDHASKVSWVLMIRSVVYTCRLPSAARAMAWVFVIDGFAFGLNEFSIVTPGTVRLPASPGPGHSSGVAGQGGVAGCAPPSPSPVPARDPRLTASPTHGPETVPRLARSWMEDGGELCRPTRNAPWESAA